METLDRHEDDANGLATAVIEEALAYAGRAWRRLPAPQALRGLQVGLARAAALSLELSERNFEPGSAVCCTECGSEVTWRTEGLVCNQRIVGEEGGGYGSGPLEIDAEASDGCVRHSIWCP